MANEDTQRRDLGDVLGAKGATGGAPGGQVTRGSTAPGRRFKVLGSNRWYGIRLVNGSGYDAEAANVNVVSAFLEASIPKLYSILNPEV